MMKKKLEKIKIKLNWFWIILFAANLTAFGGFAWLVHDEYEAKNKLEELYSSTRDLDVQLATIKNAKSQQEALQVSESMGATLSKLSQETSDFNTHAFIYLGKQKELKNTQEETSILVKELKASLEEAAPQSNSYEEMMALAPDSLGLTSKDSLLLNALQQIDASKQFKGKVSATVPQFASNIAQLEKSLSQMEDKLYLRSKTYQAIPVGIILISLLLLFLLLRRQLITPLRVISSHVHQLAAGPVSTQLSLPANGPLKEVADQINDISDQILEAADFAYRVGEGNLETQLNLTLPENESAINDSLPLALNHVRERLREFKNEEEKRNWSANGLAHFVEILRQDYTELETLGLQVITAMVNYLNCNQGVIYLCDEDVDGEPTHFEVLAAYAWGHQYNMGQRFEIGEGLVGAAIESNRTIYMTDLPESYSRIRSGLGDAQPRNILIAPLSVNGAKVGAIEIASFAPLGEHEKEFIDRLCETIAANLKDVKTNLRTQNLLLQSQELATQLTEQEQAVRQNLEKLERAQSQMAEKQLEIDGILSAIDKSIGMVEFDLKGNVQNANNSLLKLLKYRFSTIRNVTIEQLIPGFGSKSSNLDWNEILKGKYQTGEYKFQNSEGDEVWVYATFGPVLDAMAKPQKALALVSDITKEKLSALDYEGQIEAINRSNAVIEFDLGGKITRINSNFSKLIGYEPKDLLGKDYQVLIADNTNNNALYNNLWSQIPLGKPVEGEFPMVDSKGKELWLHASFNPIFDLEGTPQRIVSILADVSDQKRMQEQIKEQLEQMVAQEEELRQNMEEMQATQEEMDRNQIELNGIMSAINRSTAMLEFDLEGNILSVNDSFVELTKFGKQELESQNHRFLLSEQSQNSPEFINLWEMVVKGFPQSAEFKYRSFQGEDIWLFSTFTPVMGLDDRPYKIIQFSTDITSGKILSADFEGQVKALNLANAVMEFNLEGEVIHANKTMEKMLKSDAENLKGKPYSHLTPPDAEESEDLWRTLRSGDFVSGEFLWSNSQGREIWIKGTFNPVFDLAEAPSKVLLMAQDITHEKMLQMENQSQLELLALKEQQLRKNVSEMETTQRKLSLKEAEMRGQLNAINSTNGKFELSPDGAILASNRMFLEITGLEEGQLTNLVLPELFSEEDVEKGVPTAILTALGEDRPVSKEYKLFSETKGEIWVQFNFTPIHNEAGEVLKSLCLLTDTTEKKQQEADTLARVKELNETMTELTAAQDQLILSEKMASLGQLVAGVAHEVNTPISAVKASARNMDRVLAPTLQDLPKLMRELPEDLVILFNQMVETSVSSSQNLTTKEERKYKKEIQQYLDEIGVEDSYEIAGTLVSIRVLENVDVFLPLLEYHNAPEILRLAGNLGQLKVNIDTIGMAAEKTSKIVFALKNYSHVQSQDQFVMTNLQDNLDMILTVYQNQLKYGIEVVKEYNDIPEVPVYPDELGQVWTNIIHNAIQAMKNEGKLTLSVSQNEEMAVVTLSDNGPGIPQDIQERIFEPFFTTKPQGEGTGLGLDICKKIIEKHHGTIVVDSQPGSTVFSISLPFVQPEQEEEQAEKIELVDSQLNEVVSERPSIKVAS